MRYLSSAPPRWKPLVAGLSALAFLGLGSPALLQSQSIDSMRSNSFIIQLGNFNMTSGEKSSTGYNITDTVGQTAPGEYSSTGYIVRSGFQYIYALPRFSFRIPDLDIHLGQLAISEFAQDSNQLIVTTRSGGFTILAQVPHQLRTQGGVDFIPATTCDGSCTISTANPWISAQNHGFGFRAAGPYATADFVNATYFRPFADVSQSEVAQLIAEHDEVVSEAVIDITYRASIGTEQAAGLYTTSVDYIAVPSY